MKVSVHKLPKLVKLSTVQQGQLVQLYDDQLKPGPFGVRVVPPAIPIPAPAPLSYDVTFVDLETGVVDRFNGGTRCHVFHGAAVVLDFVEGARD